MLPPSHTQQDTPSVPQTISWKSPRKCLIVPHWLPFSQPLMSESTMAVLSQDSKPIIGKEYGRARIDLINQVQLLKMWSEYKPLSLSRWNWYTMNIRETTPATTILASSILTQVIDETQDICIRFSFFLEHVFLKTFFHTHPCILLGSVLVIFQVSFKMAFSP